MNIEKSVMEYLLEKNEYFIVKQNLATIIFYDSMNKKFYKTPDK